MAAPEVTELNTPLYQRVGENLYQLHVQTTAEQVKMKNAEQGDSSVQQEIETLRGKLDNILSASDAMVFKGVVNQDSDIAAADYQAGWTYKVGTAGTYKGQKCEVGDLIVCVKDHADSAADSDWTVVQTNIDGAGKRRGRQPARLRRGHGPHHQGQRPQDGGRVRRRGEEARTRQQDRRAGQAVHAGRRTAVRRQTHQ